MSLEHRPDLFRFTAAEWQSARDIVSSQVAELIDCPIGIVRHQLQELDDYGPHAYWYLLDNMKKPTSAESERQTLVLRLRYRMIIDSICGRRKHVRTRTLALDWFMCRNCQFSPASGFMELAVDHIIPQIRGGSDAQSNLQTLCRRCNSSKSAMTQEEWEWSGLAARQRELRSGWALT